MLLVLLFVVSIVTVAALIGVTGITVDYYYSSHPYHACSALQARVFQNSKCALSGAPLELPAVHFVCGHSFNLRSLGENEKECPLCAPQFRSILDIKRAMRTGATEQVSVCPCMKHRGSLDA